MRSGVVGSRLGLGKGGGGNFWGLLEHGGGVVDKLLHSCGCCGVWDMPTI